MVSIACHVMAHLNLHLAMSAAFQGCGSRLRWAPKSSFDSNHCISPLSFTMTMTSNTDSIPKAILAPDEDLGFPAGYFVLRSTGSDRMLDVEMGKVDDGAEILLFPEKEKSLVDGTSTSRQGLYVDCV